MNTLKELVLGKPGNETNALADKAKNGIAAIDALVAERNSQTIEIENQRKLIDRLTLENESLRQANAELTNQRDFWMRSNARFEANLNQLGSIMQVMFHEIRNQPVPQPATNVKQIAEKFAPDTGKLKNAKSVG